jgi:L-threonylcarbamoyladenylate synthase
MIVLNFDEYNIQKKALLRELTRSVFVYPTDTIYGIGCSALDERLVARVRLLKKSKQPFSIIVPSKEWIYNNCVVTEEAEEWIRKLPGPYTLIMRLKNKKAVAKNVHNFIGDDITIGVRMPNHWFLAVAYQIKVPIVTTSANVTGHDFMTSMDNLDMLIHNNVDYIFYEGEKRGIPSTIIHLEGPKVQIQSRKASSSKKDSMPQFPLAELSVK